MKELYGLTSKCRVGRRPEKLEGVDPIINNPLINHESGITRFDDISYSVFTVD